MNLNTDPFAKTDIRWQTSWTHHADNYITADAFTNGGMTVSLTPDDNASVPPGGSAYLIKAYVYNSAGKGKSGNTDRPGEIMFRHIRSKGRLHRWKWRIISIHMTCRDCRSNTPENGLYFTQEISSGGGNISSEWTKSDTYRLPYVKLQSPQIESNEAVVELTANVSTTPEVAGEDKIWTAKQTVLSWNSVDCADILH